MSSYFDSWGRGRFRQISPNRKGQLHPRLAPQLRHL